MQSHPNMTLEAELGSLPTMAISRLRERWHELFNRAPPKAFGPDLLRRSLAQRVQEKAFGGLRPAACRELERAIRALERNSSGRIEVPRRIKAGAVLIWEWKGASHRVTVLDQGFAYERETYASLSEIAREITGTRWNGPRFFGLRVIEPASPNGRPGDYSLAETAGRPPGRSRKPAKSIIRGSRLPDAPHGL